MTQNHTRQPELLHRTRYSFNLPLIHSSSLSQLSYAMAGSWSTKLHTVLQPAWDSPHDNVRNPKVHRHPPGAIWKRALGKSVFFDLAGDCFKGRRRFVRLETLGLSGIIFYEISSGHDSDGSNDLNGELEGTRSTTQLTRKSVFGDPYNPSDLGIGIDKLIDAVGAKILYFPAYACTSFSVSDFYD